MKAAVIGLGPHGRRIAQILKGMPGVSLSAVVDRREEALAWGELPRETQRLTDAAAAWSLGIDLACITTNGPSHAPLAMAAMEAGVGRVMVEKPMATSVEDCARMITVAERTGARLAVNQSRRHDPLYRWLRDQIRSGAWGEVRAIWIQRPGIGLGCLGTHYFDLIRFLSGSSVKRVTAWLDPFIGPNPRGAEFVDPGGLVVLELEGRVRGVVAQIEDGAGPMSVEIDLTGARVRVDEQTDQVEIIARDRSVKPAPGTPARFVKALLPEGLRGKTDVSLMAQGLLEELCGTAPLECDARHGLASIEVLAASYASARADNRPILLPLGEEDRRALLSVT